MAVNLGDDADTTGAVFGQSAGAFYGEEEIPQEWRSRIAHLPFGVETTNKLWVVKDEEE